MAENAKEVAEVLSLLGDGVSKGEQKELQAFVEAYFLNDDEDSCSDESSDDDDDEDISLLDAEIEPMDLGSDTDNNTESGADEGDEHEEADEGPVVIDDPLPDGGADLPPDQRNLLVGHAAEPDHELTRCQAFSCGCKKYKGEPYSNRYTAEQLCENRLNMMELDRSR